MDEEMLDTLIDKLSIINNASCKSINLRKN